MFGSGGEDTAGREQAMERLADVLAATTLSHSPPTPHPPNTHTRKKNIAPQRLEDYCARRRVHPHGKRLGAEEHLQTHTGVGVCVHVDV